MKKMIPLLVLIFSILACNSPKQKDYLNESPAHKDERMKWWRDAGFGMFIHWGPYAVPAGYYQGEPVAGVGEWIMSSAKIPVEEYEVFARDFNPVDFDANEWVKQAKSAGMKYIVITTKHHDGFCLWDSQVTDYDFAGFTAFKRDPIKELADACQKEGIVLCFYHSIMDWHHAEAKGEYFASYRENYLKPQLKELLTNYGPIGALWFDGEWIEEWTEEQGRDLYNYLRNMQPELIINNRVGKGRDGMQGMNKAGEYVGDFGTPEQEILDVASNLDWEACMTMNDTWGYKKDDHNWKSTRELIHNLVDVAAKGGNYLLNVGPDARGVIPAESTRRLEAIGQWMKVNHSVVYNSRQWVKYGEGEDVRYTVSKDGMLQATILAMPDAQKTFRYIHPKAGSEVSVLGSYVKLKWVFDEVKGTTVFFPANWLNGEKGADQLAWTLVFDSQQPQVTVPPVINYNDKARVTKELFGERARIELTAEEGARIFYQLNDGPIKEYQSPIEVTQTTALSVYAQKAGLVASEMVKAEFFHTAAFKELKLTPEASTNYRAEGNLSLFDGQRGSDNFKDGKWLGFEGDDVEIIVDLGTVKAIKQIRLSCMQNLGGWIFYPQQLTYELSQDGSAYTAAYTYQHQVTKEDSDGFSEFPSVMKDIKARYIKVKARNVGVCPAWHDGSGGKAWMFIDELLVETN